MAELAGNRARARAVVRAWRWNLGRLPARPGAAGRHCRPTGGWRQGDPAAPGAGERPAVRLLPPGLPARLPRCPRRRAGCRRGPSSAADRVRTVPTTTWPTREPRRRGSREAGRVPGRVRLAIWLVAAVIVVIGIAGRADRPTSRPSASSPRSRPGRRRSPSSSGGGTRRGWGRRPRRRRRWRSDRRGRHGAARGHGADPEGADLRLPPARAWGVVRLLRPFGSQRAALVAGLAYLAMPVALQRAGPRAVGTPSSSTPAHPGCSPAWPGPPGPSPSSGPRPCRRLGGTGGGVDGSTDIVGRLGGAPSGLLGGPLALGVLEAVLISFAPAAAIVVVLAAAGPGAVVRCSSATAAPPVRAVLAGARHPPGWRWSSAFRG